jgi:hypothetical protein
MRTTGTISILLVSATLAGCAAPVSTEPDILSRPDVPQGWLTISSDEGDLRLTLPPDFEAVSTVSGIVAQPPIQDSGRSNLEVWAASPAALVQPRGSESVRGWLDNSGFAPVAGDVSGLTDVDQISERQVELPAGRALEVVFVIQPETDAAVRLVIYAIETADGIGVLRINGSPPSRLEERTRELLLIPLLAEFGP